jgi:RNA polymerase sigma-70 factor, ECF subfamily
MGVSEMSRLPELSMPEVLIDPEESAKATAVYADWSDLVARIRSGQTDGMEELYRLFSRGIRFYVVRQLGPDEVDDRVHDTLLAVVEAIRRDELREPERLMGFVRAIVGKQIADHSNRAAERRTAESVVPNELRRDNPEEAVAFHRRTALIDQVLATLSPRDHEILTRFYVQEESRDQICKEMGLTETQFRLLKSRAKARFGALAKKYFSLREQSHHLWRESDPNQRPNEGETTAVASTALEMGRIMPVIAHAVAVFGDENKASHWLATPLPLFGDRSPSKLLEGQEGTELVEQVLTRIEHNIPS